MLVEPPQAGPVEPAGRIEFHAENVEERLGDRVDRASINSADLTIDGEDVAAGLVAARRLALAGSGAQQQGGQNQHSAHRPLSIQR